MTEFVNDVDHLYDQPITTNAKGKFVCPVCKKDYATRAGIHNHIKQRTCAPTKVLFENTITEQVGFDIYNLTVGDFNSRARVNLNSFRKSKFYRGVLEYALYCMNNKIDPQLYYFWIKSAKNPRYLNQVFSFGVKDSNLVEFRDHLIKNQDLIKSDEFYERNEERLLSDDPFLVRSIERGDLGLDFCMKHEDMDFLNRIDNLSDALRIRLLAVVTVVER